VKRELCGSKIRSTLMIDDQKEQHVAVSQQLRHRANEENFINNAVTGNETWFNDIDMTLKRKTFIPHEGY
jgi:hypothetical protein